MKRTHNEDNFSIMEESGLYIVADGMGGHASGEIASTGGVWSAYAADCGHALGSCPTGREYAHSNEWMADGSESSESGCASNTAEALWSIAFGVSTTIELPGSGDSYTLDNTVPNDGVNESTGHYYICYS